MLRLRPSIRAFSTTARRLEIIQLPRADALPKRIYPTYQANHQNDLLGVQWPAPLRNVLLMKKEESPNVTESLVEFSYHLQNTYPSINLIFEPSVASAVHAELPSPVYSLPQTNNEAQKVLQENVDLITTLGGDGTILHAAGLYNRVQRVPPILAFSMGTLGFLGEWKFGEYKRAFREVYMSGASAALEQMLERNYPDEVPKTVVAPPPTTAAEDPWASFRGKFMGPNRHARILLRHRLQVSVQPPSLPSASSSSKTAKSPLTLATAKTLAQRKPQTPQPLYALNEIIMHRGRAPHLCHISISVNGRHLTDAIADGLIVASPTGSTAYSLSSGGCIVHPLVSSLVLTPICPRSLSFRPLVLPANAEIVLRVSDKNRSEGVDVSVDGQRLEEPLGRGGEVRITGEDVGLAGFRDGARGEVPGGVPSIVRGLSGGQERGEDHWVGGLNGLLKFNYPFGDGV
ncbi:ATP-NAD kinase-like domain-containing protein [Phyllosticta capitalensis]|uniref:ATP-NAD kinase-like domain-containing protein n=1 Tax=Phyllosticta capitalensis TaxID=121624 RepID=A0ABR1Z2W7_9PEZI